MTTLDGKIVLITGAGGGFGREMIRQFLAAGSHLILADRDAVLLDQIAANVASQPNTNGKILGYLAADLASEAGCDDLYRQAQALAPHVDVLVNNAGIAYGGPFTAVPTMHWERLMQVNLLAPMRLTARFLPGMMARQSGHIVNISSVAGLVGVPGIVSYSTAKWGLRGFSEALANEVAVHGIAVTAIYPFFARTAILESPQFGPEQPPLPNWMLYTPQFIVAALLDGIRKRKRHVYPGMIPKVINLIQRFVPFAVPRLTQPLNPSKLTPTIELPN